MVLAVSGTVIGAYSHKQTLVTKSSTESEIVALSDGSPYAIWVREWALCQGHKIGPLVIWQDNQSVLALISNRNHASRRTRHINIRYFLIIDRKNKGELLPMYKPTRLMVADLLTKVVIGTQFRYLRDLMMGNLKLN